MRFYNILYKKHKFVGLLLLCILLTGTINAQDQKEKKAGSVAVSLKVADDNGNPISKAQVVIGPGVIHAETDENGALTFNALLLDFVTVSSAGYEKNVSLVQDIIANNIVVLKKSKLFKTSDDAVPLPFTTIKKGNLTGSASVIQGNQLEKYPTSDIRNAFTGLATGLEVIEKNGSPGLSSEEGIGKYGVSDKIQTLIRGRDPIVIIDDIPTNIYEMPLDPQEIESVTIIKDIVGKTMYGPSGSDGIIYIKTKRGKKNEPMLSVNIEDGVNVVDRFPEWTSGADYARLNNQANINNGLTPRYSESDISRYALNDPYDKYHPSVNFRKVMLKNTMSFKRANISSSGGNDNVQYHAYVGYTGEGDIYKIGPTSDYNRINTRSNIDFRINDDIKVQFDFYGGLTFRRSVNYGYATDESSASTNIIEMDAVLPDITSIPPIAFPIYASYDSTSNVPWFGVNSTYKSNPIGNLMNNGYYTESGRTGTSNVALEYDMSRIIKGLKSRTYLGINLHNLVRIGKAEDYIAYIATPATTPAGTDTILLSKVHNGVDISGQLRLHDYYYQRFSVYENLSYERSFGVHDIQSTLTYYLFKSSMNGIEEPRRQQSMIWTGMYTFKNKFVFQGVMNYAGSYSFDKGKKFELFPSAGVGWVISEENFMSNLKFINYLKLRAEAGILGFESSPTPFYYRDDWNGSTGPSFGPYPIGQWFGVNTDNSVYQTSTSRTGNPDLTWEKRKEFSVGIDALLFNNKLSLELNYWNILRDGIVSQITGTLPYLVGISSARPYVNFNKTRYFGAEAAIQYTDKIGGFRYSIGGNAAVRNSKKLKSDEPDYRHDYQSEIGLPADGYWGLTHLGKFTSDAEALEVPQVFDEVLHEGDLKYKDMNGDGVVDDNDRSMIGHTDPRLVYAINAKISYKNFDLTVIGTGRAFYDIALTNQYFWNGWGDNNYSNFVRENIGGAYPKLTYNKVNNNFVASDFWLVKGGFFKIQNIEIAYNLPPNAISKIGAKAVRFFVRGANLLTISDVKDVDPESINSGVIHYPLFKTFSGGVKFTF